jgi:hypothetical protein
MAGWWRSSLIDGGGGTVANSSPSPAARFGFPLIGGAAKGGSSWPFSAIFGANGGARVKALLEADVVSLRAPFPPWGHHHGTALLPHHQHQRKLLIQLAGSDNGGTIVLSPSWRRCLGRWWYPRRGTMESSLAAALSEGFQGAMYTVGGASQSSSFGWFGSAAHSLTLRRLRVGGCVGCAILQSRLPEFSSSVVTRFGNSASPPFMDGDSARRVFVIWLLWVVL